MERRINMILAGKRTAQVLLWLVFLYLPVAVMFIPGVPGLDLGERAELNELPTLKATSKSITSFPRRFQAYFDDHFGFRNFLVRAYGRICVFWLHISPSRRVIVGKDGYLFLWENNERVSFRRSPTYSDNEKHLLDLYLGLLKSWTVSRGMFVTCLVCPDKSTIYPELMPACLKRADGPSRMDQFLDACTRSGIPAPDLRSIMQEHKADMQLYYKLDTHWAAPGIHLVYQHLINNILRPYFDIIPARDWSEFKPKHSCLITGDLSRMIGLKLDLMEPSQGMKDTSSDVALARSTGTGPGSRHVFKHQDTTKPSAMLLADSFGMGMETFLPAHFSEFTAVWSQDLNIHAIEKHNPKILIVEWVERALPDTDSLQSYAATLLWLCSNVVVSASMPTHVGYNAADESSALGIIRRASIGKPNKGWLTFGPHARMGAGNYRAVFRFKRGPVSRGQPVARLEVCIDASRTVLVQKDVSIPDLEAPGLWGSCELPFSIAEPGTSALEVRVFNYGTVDLSVDTISVVPANSTSAGLR